MYKPIVFHTLSIFEQTVRSLPPLLPKELLEELVLSLEGVRENTNIEIDELEDLMADWGKRLWPQNQAFANFYKIHEDEFGHKLLLQRLSPVLRDRCENFFEMGGSFKDVYRGAAAHHFDLGEREELLPVLVELKFELEKLARHAVVHNHRQEYLEKVVYFSELLANMEKHLGNLNVLREKEIQEESRLADDIEHFIKGVKHGFAKLGPAVDYEHVSGAYDYFVGRKKERSVYP